MSMLSLTRNSRDLGALYRYRWGHRWSCPVLHDVGLLPVGVVVALCYTVTVTMVTGVVQRIPIGRVTNQGFLASVHVGEQQVIEVYIICNIHYIPRQTFNTAIVTHRSSPSNI